MVSGIIVAAGKGIRMNRKVRKQYLSLEGQPILYHTLMAIDAGGLIDSLFLCVPEDDFDYCRRGILSPHGLEKKVTLVAGGLERQDSVYNGLLAVNDTGGIVVIHDGVRPFVQAASLATCIDEAKISGACILGIPVSDTIKRVDASGHIDDTLDRQSLWLAQTPQVFQYNLIRKAHETARKKGIVGTDDALLVEQLGNNVKIIAGNRYNIKITTPEDLVVARAILMANVRV